MAVYGQGAPGVRIRLRDLSEVSLVTDPNITAGIVGYSAKGEFNKIIDLTSTADQDLYLGNGFNNARYNQGLYAARAILNAGGFVEYVRPYGETVITDDSDPMYNTNQALKTDTFTVAFDYSTGAENSFDIKHFASTRYVEDGLTGIGSRKINTISEALKHNTNVDFDLSADAMTDKDGGTKKVMLFAIMNSDPTAAIRAGDRLSITSIKSSTVNKTTTVTVKVASFHGLSIGDSIVISGTSNFNGTATVVSIIDETSFTYGIGGTSDVSESVGTVYANTDTANSGVDYINVKTVAAGSASKKYDSITVSTDLDLTADGETIEMETASGANATFEFVIGDTYTGDNYPVTIVNDTFSTDYDASATTIRVNNGSKFNVGDQVHVTTLVDVAGIEIATLYTVKSVTTNFLTLVRSKQTVETGITLTADGTGVIINLTATLRSFVSALSNVGIANASGATATITGITTGVMSLGTAQASKFDINDLVILQDSYATNGVKTDLPSGLTQDVVYKVASVNTINNKITLKNYAGTALTITDSTNSYKIINLSKGVTSATINTSGIAVEVIGAFSLTAPTVNQTSLESFFDFTDITKTNAIVSTKLMDTDPHMIKQTEGRIVIDSDIGRQFLNLGLAVEDYQDINFDGTEERVYQLTAEGEIVAKMYVYVTYYFAGETYQFSGTLVEYAYGDTNLYLKNSAEYYENGWTLVMNDNSSLEDGISEFSLADSVSGGIVTSTVTKVAFDGADPAIVNDAVWTYNPKNNASSAVLSSAWQLFLNKDASNADMLVASGTAISNLFVKNMEQINYTVMDSMLEICEKRKDVFAIFDGVDEPKIDVALKKMIGIGSVGDLSRWGAIFDGRSIFSDNIYTKINAQAVKSIEVAAIICYNRAGNVYWLPPAGYNTGRIPYSLAKKQKFIRTYNYADDKNSDIARLYDANINPTRVNDQGQFIYGQKTMLKRMTALNRLNVIMLVAGIHKRFGDFLDKKVFQLNTAALRSSIQADLQAQLELIKSANPAGLTAGVVICDETNNTPDIIDTNQLIVDVVLQPTKTAEFITLRTTVQRTGADLKITNTIVGG